MKLILFGTRDGVPIGTVGAPRGRGRRADKGAANILCDKVSELSLVTNYGIRWTINSLFYLLKKKVSYCEFKGCWISIKFYSLRSFHKLGSVHNGERLNISILGWVITLEAKCLLAQS
jgi:hypothetical protein